MKKALTIIALATLVRLAAADAAAPANALQNGGFDAWGIPPASARKPATSADAPLSWQAGGDAAAPAGTITQDTATKHSGVAAVRMEAKALTDGLKVAQLIAIPPNTKFHLQGWVKGEGIVSEPAGKGGVTIWINTGPQADFYAHQNHVTVAPNPKVGTFDWQLVQYDGTTGSDTAKVNIVVQLRQATGVLWVDDMELMVDPSSGPVPPAAPAPVAGLILTPPLPKVAIPPWATAPVVAAPVASTAHIWNSLKVGKKLNVAYLGGSVTAGSGASDAKTTSWRALTMAWFKTQFPDAQINEIDASFGGTGCDLGACRLQQDVLSKNPDLLFVEFAVNDGGPPARHTEAMEGIVRHVRSTAPDCVIVFVYVADRGMIGAYNQGVAAPGAVATEERVADFYGVPSVNAGKALADQIKGGLPIGTAYHDNVHPADPGHAIYSKAITDYLSAHEDDKPGPVPPLGSSLSPAPWETATLVDATTVAAPGWTVDPASMGGRLPHQLTCNVPGTELTFNFTGSFVGLYWLFCFDGGNLQCSIDDGTLRTASVRDRYTSQGTRPGYLLLADDLPPGPHVLHLKIAADSPVGSTGHWVRLGAFMTSSP